MWSGVDHRTRALRVRDRGIHSDDQTWIQPRREGLETTNLTPKPQAIRRVSNIQEDKPPREAEKEASNEGLKDHKSMLCEEIYG